MKQPLERREKLILVSFSTSRQRVWCLLPALKVGDHYRVAPAQLDGLVTALNVQQGATIAH